jgi:hypothetical protein
MSTKTNYAAGDVVKYGLDLGEVHVLSHNCSQVVHHGTVTAVEDDASGDQVVTVEFDCGLTQDILASELQPAE